MSIFIAIRRRETETKAKVDVHLSGDDDQLGGAGEYLSSVLGWRVGPWSYFLTGGGRGVCRASCCEQPHGVYRGVALPLLEGPGW